MTFDPLSERLPVCALFIDSEMSQRELVAWLTPIAFAPGEPPCEIDLMLNDDYDTKRRLWFPDGFIHYRYHADLTIDAPQPAQVGLIAALLQALWDDGIPAVAACGFEALLPNNGGYRHPAVPFPR